MVFALLSHKLSRETPAFAAGDSLTISPIKEIERGGSSNSYLLSFPNHIGTHIDAPKHFDPDGKAISSYSLSDFIFEHPLMIEIPKRESELITASDLQEHHSKIASSDLLLLKTGFQRYREVDPKRYATLNPGFSAEAAKYLVDNFPLLRAIGLDTVSASAVQYREEGRTAHRILLAGRNFFIIEDLNLLDYPLRVIKVFVVPFFVLGVDSVPCTVFAET